jgi:hypothetical protein
MTSVKEFIEVRSSIETLADELTLFVERKAIKDSRQHLDKANQQLETLKGMAVNDVQVHAAGRLARQLMFLGMKVESMKEKTSVKKTGTEKKLKAAV